MYKCVKCPFECDQVNPLDDTQGHMLICPVLNNNTVNNMKLDLIYGDIVDQKIIAAHMSKLIRRRNRLIEEMEAVSPTPSLPGASLDQTHVQ